MEVSYGESDGPVVPGKPPNKAGRPAAEAVEGRGPAKGNPLGRNALRTPSRAGAPSALERVRQAAGNLLARLGVVSTRAAGTASLRCCSRTGGACWLGRRGS